MFHSSVHLTPHPYPVGKHQHKQGDKEPQETRNVVIIRDADCKRPNSPSSNGTFRSSSFGRLLQLHLLYTVPSFNNTSPGLERTMVFNVISSVMPKDNPPPSGPAIAQSRHHRMPSDNKRHTHVRRNSHKVH